MRLGRPSHVGRGEKAGGSVYHPHMAGEDAHDSGRLGVQKAKRWLERTTRVDQSWTNQDRGLKELLSFEWPNRSTKPFTFDLGGTFRGEPMDGQTFVAEVKHYRAENNLPDHFRSFLAKCYVALGSHPDRCDNFLWISWAPFQARQWDSHTSVASVKAALNHAENRSRCLVGADNEDVNTQWDEGRLASVSQRVWLVTMSDRQCELVPTKEHYAEVIKRITEEAVA